MAYYNCECVSCGRGYDEEDGIQDSAGNDVCNDCAQDADCSQMVSYLEERGYTVTPPN